MRSGAGARTSGLGASLAEILTPARTALLIIDMQNDFCAAGGMFRRGGLRLLNRGRVVASTRELLSAARKFGVLPVFIQFAQLAGGLSDHPSYRRVRYTAGADAHHCVPGTWGYEVIDELRPLENEPVIGQKFRGGAAFDHTGIKSVLRSRGVKSVVLAGVVTEGCILFEANNAKNHDYNVVVASDCVSSYNSELHRAALRILRAFFDVLESREIMRIWASRKVMGKHLAMRVEGRQSVV